MRHNVDGRKLGRNKSHRKALYKNLVIALIAHERIRTTTPKAKEARRLAERMITFAKRGDLHARRHVASILNDKAAVKKLFDELGPRYSEREGGYTRVLKVGGARHGDGAEMALLEFVKDGDRDKKKEKKTATKKAAAKKKSAAKGKAAASDKKAKESAAKSKAKTKETAEAKTAKDAGKKKAATKKKAVAKKKATKDDTADEKD